MMRILFPLLIILGLFFSCKKKETESPKPETTIGIKANDPNLTTEEIAALQFSFGNHKVEDAEAQQIAFTFMDEALKSGKSNARLEEGAPRTLSSKTIVWYKVDPATNAQGRLEADNIPLFIYNFKTPTDSTAGFTIVCGDKRLPQVLASTLDGTIKDTANNTGAKLLLANIPAYNKS